ncbi:glycosyl transferase [Candidatus Woesearchaeota archaeon]|nr:glycosyl transferase [Candidatus Woesearchaeota archaeon]|tara:strand:- start:1597 stop:2325 length:729 start_codon:yes stop_codon:yes gene_type:complete
MEKLSVVIPAYNEERYIEEIITRVKKVNLKFLNLQKEIVVVDDGSTDKTASIASKIKGVKLIRHIKNSGKGAAIRTGLKHATGSIILIQDADLEYNPNEMPKVVRPIVERKADVVYGSRYLDPNQKARNKTYLKKVHKNAYQLFYMGGRGLTLIANFLYNAKITDEATCYKAFRAKIIKSLNLRCTRFEFCPEVTAKVAKRGIKIMEVPISYTPRSFEEGKKIKMRDGIEAFWTLLKYRFFD